MIGRRLVGLVVATVIFLVSGEILARALDIVDRLNGYERLLFAPGPDADLPYLLRAGVETLFFGTDVRVNRLGLRGPEIATDVPPGVRRVLVLGDSVAFGHALPEESALSARLADALGAPADGRYEVINAGVPGYDTTAEVRLLERLRPLLRPDIVVVVFSLNDYDVAPIYGPLGVLSQRELEDRTPRWYDRSAFLVLLRWLLGWTRGSLLHQVAARYGEPLRRLAALDDLVERTHVAFYRNPDPAHWDRMRAAFRALRAAAAGCQLLVVISPEAWQVEKSDADLTAQQRVLALCHETGVPCLDLRPIFAAAGDGLFLDALHPSARGYDVAARAIAAALRHGAAS